MMEIYNYIDNYAKKYAKEVIQQQRMIRAFEHDLRTNIACIEYEMQNVRSIDLSAVKVKSQKDREQYLIEKMLEKDELESKRKSFFEIILEFDKHLGVLDKLERSIVEYELEWLVIDHISLAKDLGLKVDEVKIKEASALLKIGHSLLKLKNK